MPWGARYESKDKEYTSADGLKTMTVDAYGQVNISIQDGFGNTLISKDEAAGTWTESTYEYGSEDNGGNETEKTAKTMSMKKKKKHPVFWKKKTYWFEPDEKKFIVNENGETVANFYMTGKGSELLNGSKNFYDDLGNEIGSAEFMNGELDKAHCTSFRFGKSKNEVTGEEDRGTDNYHRL